MNCFGGIRNAKITCFGSISGTDKRSSIALHTQLRRVWIKVLNIMSFLGMELLSK